MDDGIGIKTSSDIMLNLIYAYFMSCRNTVLQRAVHKNTRR